MNEALMKQSILKKTVKVRDNINLTPNSGKSVRFQGVEFMIITDEDSEKGSQTDITDQDNNDGGVVSKEMDTIDFSINQRYNLGNTLAPNKRVNLFRIGGDQNPAFSHYAQTNRTRLSYNTPSSSRYTKDNAKRWNNNTALSKSTTTTTTTTTTSAALTTTKPPIAPRIRPLHQHQRPLLQARVQSGHSISSVSSSNTLTSNNNNNQQSRINSASTIQSTISTATATRSNYNTNTQTNISNAKSPLPQNSNNNTNYSTNAQAQPNLSLYSYLLQGNNNNEKDENPPTPSSMRSQTKRLSLNELHIKPFTPRVQQKPFNQNSGSIVATATSRSNTPALRVSQSTPTFHSTSPGIQNNFVRATAMIKSPRKGGVIHVNSRNLSYLTTSMSNHTDKKSNSYENSTTYRHTTSTTDKILFQLAAASPKAAPINTM